MIAYVHTTGDYGMNARNFRTIRKFIRTLLSMVQLGSNRLKMVHIKASHMSMIWGLYFLRSKFPCLDVFRYLKAIVFVSKLCSLSLFFFFSIQYFCYVFGNILTTPHFFSRSFDDVYHLPLCLVLLFCCTAVFPWYSDNHVC